MTPEDFRRIALSMPKSVEVYRRGRSHFRVDRRAFATSEGPGDAVATVNLTPDQQSMFALAAPKAFVPVLGGWGRLGRTNALLAAVTEPLLESALGAAWKNLLHVVVAVDAMAVTAHLSHAQPVEPSA